MPARLEELSPVDGVRLWLAPLDLIAESDLEHLRAQLDPEEAARAQRFHFEHDRRRFTATRGLLRELLGRILQAEPAKLVFEYGGHGKPALAAPRHDPALRFNVSHSGGWAMFAVAQDFEIGIDLEAGERLPHEEELDALAARILSARELQAWRALPDAATRRRAFLRAWTRKEACAKAGGRGVFDHLAEIEVALDAADPQPALTVHRAHRPNGLTSHWLLHDLPAPAGFAAALARAAELEEIVGHAQGFAAGNF